MPRSVFRSLPRKPSVVTLLAASAFVYAQQAPVPASDGGPAQAVANASAGRGQARDGGPFTGSDLGGAARVDPGINLISNPYRLTKDWPTLNPGMKWGAAINFIPDNKGGTWALLRTEPP